MKTEPIPDFVRHVKCRAWREFVLFPKANLHDYYKLFFQGTFGPGHLISDYESALHYIQTEVEGLNITMFPYLQDISFFNPYTRVSLELVKRNILRPEELTELVLDSCLVTHKITEAEWLAIWSRIEAILFEIMPALKDETIREAIRLQLPNGMFHHSDKYRDCYHPYYRLIRNDIIPAGLLRFL